jgi:rabenosyn-5
MFDLQSLPTPRSSTGNSAASISPHVALGTDASNLFVDIDSVKAKQLQPLLEQEALLESFIEEAQAHRKFEDLKALKINLAEIRQEIERLLRSNALK